MRSPMCASIGAVRVVSDDRNPPNSAAISNSLASPVGEGSEGVPEQPVTVGLSRSAHPSAFWICSRRCSRWAATVPVARFSFSLDFREKRGVQRIDRGVDRRRGFDDQLSSRRGNGVEQRFRRVVHDIHVVGRRGYAVRLPPGEEHRGPQVVEGKVPRRPATVHPGPPAGLPSSLSPRRVVTAISFSLHAAFCAEYALLIPALLPPGARPRHRLARPRFPSPAFHPPRASRFRGSAGPDSDPNSVRIPAENARDREALPRPGDAGVNAQPVVLAARRVILRNRGEVPGGSPRQPRLFACPKSRRSRPAIICE